MVVHELEPKLIGNIELINSGFSRPKNSSVKYKQFGYASWKSFASPDRGEAPRGTVEVVISQFKTFTRRGKMNQIYVLLTVHLGIILFNDQLDAQFLFAYVYFNPLHVSSILVLIIRRFNCINTIYGIRYGISYMVYAGLDVPSKPAYQTVKYIEWHIPDIVLIQMNLLMLSTWMLETCRELK